LKWKNIFKKNIMSKTQNLKNEEEEENNEEMFNQLADI
jgi:hypothetical protein